MSLSSWPETPIRSLSLVEVSGAVNVMPILSPLLAGVNGVVSVTLSQVEVSGEARYTGQPDLQNIL